MSCKLIRAGDAASAAVQAWMPLRLGSVSGHPAGAKPEPVNADLQRDIDARVKAAFEQGQAAGEAAAAQRAQQQAAQNLEPVIARWNQMMQELAGMRKRFRSEAEGDTVKLAIAIARRVLYRELATDPEAILGLVMAAFQKLNARETHRLRVSPGDAAMLSEFRSRIELPAAVEILGDASLGPGSVVFETARGELDATVSTQLAEIERGLADITRRHATGRQATGGQAK
ncbi:MAG TPA: FliH/SctL family protein [Bryobacteraceae bacterium]|nr:FliH/SctL family protein [Bryobacteraceae bacterium]